MTHLIGALHGSFVEAWQELRLHKLRVLLSLIGVAIAVCSLTMVVAMSMMAQDVLRIGYEQQAGREATVTFELEGSEMASDPQTVSETLTPVLEEFGITHASLFAQGETNVVHDLGLEYADTKLVSPSHRTIYSTQIIAGRWFTAQDTQNLSPAVVVNENILSAIGAQASELPLTIDLSADGTSTVSATVIGVAPGNTYDYGEMWMLARAPAVADVLSSPPMYSVHAWVPPEIADDLVDQLNSRVSATTGESWFIYRTDYFQEGSDPLSILRTILLAIAGLILFLGVMGLVNISLVTVQQRVREIGIRRSFGATGARIFFAVLMESVVATSLAGVVGIAVSVLILRSPVLLEVLSDGMAIAPTFPASAAAVGFLVAVGAGAVAGLVPAIIATRARIVDAIRA